MRLKSGEQVSLFFDREAVIADIQKTKYKQSKTESNSAQNALQKEITSLRETGRTMQTRLRDIEVSNDDMERKARNTTSSLEDLESKYSVAIERGVMADEDIRAGEQEREALRIEAQRLRDELNDLRIEAEIRQDKLCKAEAEVDRLQNGNVQLPLAELDRPQSALSETSPATSLSSPTVATPQTKSATSTISEAPTPPSPPTSDKSNPPKIAPSNPKPHSISTDPNITPRPSTLRSRVPRHSRGPSAPVNNAKKLQAPQSKVSQSSDNARKGGLVQSGSLYHLHGLMNKMQSLEQRVHSVRSKLPAPTSTPPRASPRSGSAIGTSFIPSNVTVRSSKKRAGGSNASSVYNHVERPGSRLSSAFSQGLERPSSRLSTGIPQPSPSREAEGTRPPSRDHHSSRPGSRASLSSRQSMTNLPNALVNRPASRQSIGGARTPMTHHPSTIQTEPRRPRSSLGGYAASTISHGYSSSISKNSTYDSHMHGKEEEENEEVVTPTPSRRSTFNRESISNIPAFPGNKSIGKGVTAGRRTSSGTGDMRPPERKPTRKLSEVGESY